MAFNKHTLRDFFCEGKRSEEELIGKRIFLFLSPFSLHGQTLFLEGKPIKTTTNEVEGNDNDDDDVDYGNEDEDDDDGDNDSDDEDDNNSLEDRDNQINENESKIATRLD